MCVCQQSTTSCSRFRIDEVNVDSKHRVFDSRRSGRRVRGRVASSTKLIPQVTGVSISNCVCVCLFVCQCFSFRSESVAAHACICCFFIPTAPLPTSIRRSGCFSDFSTIHPIQPGFVLRSHSVAVCACGGDGDDLVLGRCWWARSVEQFSGSTEQ